jgi:hypothetical protein
LGNKFKIIARRKNPPAYQVKCSAVKNTQAEKRGIDSIRHKIPQMTANLGLRLKIKKIKTTKKATS